MYISCIQQKWQKLRSPSPKVMLSSLHIASRYRTHPVLFYHATFTVSIMLLHDCTEESLTQAFGSPHARKGVKPTMMAAGWWLWGPCHWKAKWSSWKLRQGAMGHRRRLSSTTFGRIGRSSASESGKRRLCWSLWNVYPRFSRRCCTQGQWLVLEILQQLQCWLVPTKQIHS